MTKVDEESLAKYRKLSSSLAEPSVLTKLMAMFERRYGLSELLDWMHERLKFDKGDIERHNDPLEILVSMAGADAESLAFFSPACA